MSLLYFVKNKSEIHFLQLLIQTLYGKSHHVEITSGELLGTDISYPFLNALSTGLVHRAVVFDIELNFFIGQFIKSHLGD